MQWNGSEWIGGTCNGNGLVYFGNGFRYNYGEDIDIVVVVGW